jgi:UDP-N-acetylglucosamine 2-epimerase (hydrolysing)
MVGNSSAGVREAPFLGLPSLDVGTRQNNRAQADSVTCLSAFQTNELLQWLKSHWMKRENECDGFGRGTASSLFVDIVKSSAFWQSTLQKVFVKQ